MPSCPVKLIFLNGSKMVIISPASHFGAGQQPPVTAVLTTLVPTVLSAIRVGLYDGKAFDALTVVLWTTFKLIDEL